MGFGSIGKEDATIWAYFSLHSAALLSYQIGDKKSPELPILCQINVTVDQSSFQVASYYIVMSLLDPEQYRADDLADLYRQAWGLELFFRDFKTTLCRGILSKRQQILESAKAQRPEHWSR